MQSGPVSCLSSPQTQVVPGECSQYRLNPQWVVSKQGKKTHLCDGLGLYPAISHSLVWGSLELVGVYAGIFVIKEFVENDHGK